MKYIFLDESGELGFKSTSSKYFVITLLLCDGGEVYSLRRIMKKVRQKIIKKKLKRNRSLREDFDNYIRKNITQKNNGCNIKIQHENSQKEGCLQVLDFVSWSIFRNYENSDSRFMDIIKNKIVIKKEVFEKLSGP